MNEDQSKIDDLNKSIYSRNAPDIRSKRRLRLHDSETDIKEDWEHPEEIIIPQSEQSRVYKDKTMSFFTKILITSIIFFVIALGIGTLLFFNGANIVSGNNVDININSPASVAGGEPLSFDIQIVNHNNIKLEKVNLTVDFPSGTTYADDSLKEFKTSREQLGDIAPGGLGQKTLQVVVYGEENSKKEIKVAIEYQVKGSNAVFQKEKSFDLLISSSPISLSVSSFKEVNARQEFELTVLLTSNSKEVIKNLLLKAVYPFGFSYISSDIKTISDNTTWKIGDLPPGGKKTIKIVGKLEGQDDEVRVFRFITGAYKLGNDKVIGTQYISGSQEVSVKKPFMTVGIGINGDTSSEDSTTPFNSSVGVDVSYFNNLGTAITDAEIRVKLSGSAFDKASVSAEQGLYKSAENEIIWNGLTTSDLVSVPGGGSGEVSFSIVPRNLSASQKTLTNPYLKFSVSIKGKRNSESNVPENIVSTLERLVKVSSSISLGGQVVRSSGPFTNTGHIPPRAESDTTYTIIWTIDNTHNNISDAIVTASLPAYVKWLGKKDPSSEDITYDTSTGRLLWNAGSVGTYTAGSARRKSIAFQVSLNPSISQVETIPVLVNQANLTAVDDFTGEELQSNLGVLTTRFSTDPSYKDGDEKVVK